MHFSLSVSKVEREESLNALTLFSLAANGDLPFLYLLSDYKDPLVVRQIPLILPPTEIVPPLGGENLVVVLCHSPATGLHTLLARVQLHLPKPEQLIFHLHQNRCQVGQYAVFSGK